MGCSTVYALSKWFLADVVVGQAYMLAVKNCDRRSPKCRAIRSTQVKQTAQFVGAWPQA